MKTVECTRGTLFKWFIVLFRINSLISQQFECLTYICIYALFQPVRLVKSLNLVIVD